MVWLVNNNIGINKVIEMFIVYSIKQQPVQKYLEIC